MGGVAVAAAWAPRGELARLQRFHPRLQNLYTHLSVSLPKDAAPDVIAALRALPNTSIVFYEGWSGRHLVVEDALKADVEYIQYIDMDRLIRWVETRPDELAAVVQQVQTVDCLVLGRTPTAYATHPRPLVETETLPNAAFSHWFGREMDFCAGSKGLSRAAAEYILARSKHDVALSMDIEWLVYVQRAGMTWDYREVDGLDWETADRHRDVAATAEQQAALATKQANDPNEWALRVQVARDILARGLAAIDADLAAVLHL